MAMLKAPQLCITPFAKIWIPNPGSLSVLAQKISQFTPTITKTNYTRQDN